MRRLACGTALALALALAAAADCAAAGPKLLNADVHFPEGPVWRDGRLYYVEYDRNTITTWSPAFGNGVFATLPGCGPSAVLDLPDGGFLATCYDNGTIGRVGADGKLLPGWDKDRDGNGFTGPNDFAPDRHGGIYFTASGHPGTAVDGKVYYIDAQRTITLVASGLDVANGVVVSPDGRSLYVVETEAHLISKFRISAAGALSGRRVFLDLDALTGHVGHIWPDGVKIDRRGQIYVGQNPRDVRAPLAGTIFVVDARARLLRELHLPSPGVPNFAFSPDGRTLYVTALDQVDQSPYQGKLYAIATR